LLSRTLNKDFDFKKELIERIWLCQFGNGGFPDCQTNTVLDLILVAIHLGHINGDDHLPYSAEWYQCMNTDLNNDNDHNVLDLILVAISLGT